MRQRRGDINILACALALVAFAFLAIMQAQMRQLSCNGANEPNPRVEDVGTSAHTATL